MGFGVHFRLQNGAQNGVQNYEPSNIAESVIFITPHAYRQGRKCPKGSKNGSKFDPKSFKKVMSKRTLPKDHHFEVPGSPEERQGSKKLPKGVPQRLPKRAKVAFKRGFEIHPTSKEGPRWLK